MSQEATIQVTSVKGVTAELFHVALCTICGWSPHRIGEHGSCSCEPCRLREIARQAAIHAPREAS